MEFKTKTKKALWCDVTFVFKSTWGNEIDIIKECYIEPLGSDDYYNLVWFSENGRYAPFMSSLCLLMQRAEIEKVIYIK